MTFWQWFAVGVGVTVLLALWWVSYEIRRNARRAKQKEEALFRSALNKHLRTPEIKQMVRDALAERHLGKVRELGAQYDSKPYDGTSDVDPYVAAAPFLWPDSNSAADAVNASAPEWSGGGGDSGGGGASGSWDSGSCDSGSSSSDSGSCSSD